jgi:aspartyl-tRNA(Asn)/glutamyl-tRNA(Gln) amidotransferase subunit A
VNAFIATFRGKTGVALSRARGLDARLRAGKGEVVSGLFGIPLAIKDNIFLAGHRTTAASFYFRDFAPKTTAEIVESAVSLGCIPLGKTNLHELALGATSTSSYFGPVRHPLDPTRIAGGSSGGSAVAVAIAGGPLLGLGTDTGGSTRVPASLCGVVGFKPTLGRLSLEGVFPLSPTLDHAGLLTRTMPDMVASFEALTGERVPAPRAKMKVAVLTGYFLEGAERTVLRNFWRAIDRMGESERFEAVEVEAGPEYARYGVARVAILLKEAAWFYGQMVASKDARERMSSDVLTLLRRGLRTGELRYLDANLVRLEAMNALGRVFKEVDIIAVPTTRITAPRMAEVTGSEAGEIRQLLLRNVELFNLCGLPAVSVPSNPGSEGLPTGLQLACRAWEDSTTLLAGAEALKAIAG